MYNPQLDTFIRVADAGSFSKATEENYITPTAVIKQINSLEAALRLRLFERSHRGLTLTESGKSLYNDAKYVIQYCRDSVRRANDAAAHHDKVIRIGTSPMTPGEFLLGLWPKIHSVCPDVKFQLFPFDNTPENAREILHNLGRNIDVVAGWFDETMVTLFGKNEAWGVLMAATIGVPLYACGGGTIPLLQGWLWNGMSMDSATAFMITGPVTKITNLGAMKIVLGAKHFVFYIAFGMAFALATGLLVNMISL
jgi:hypothetical protein